jgi:metal-responsive CopG/Arc/MetJ family transcriptional regulator
MKPIQILMEDELLREVDEVAKRSKLDRSKLIREALRRYLAAARVRDWEQSDIEAYRRKPLTKGELEDWQKVRVWPEE